MKIEDRDLFVKCYRLLMSGELHGEATMSTC